MTPLLSLAKLTPIIAPFLAKRVLSDVIDSKFYRENVLLSPVTKSIIFSTDGFIFDSSLSIKEMI